MATKREKITEDDTQCSVCRTTFRNPRILPCKHMFCHECLCGVVKRHDGKSAFPCPLCRASTNTDIRITIEPSDRLVNQFPVDREMQSHLERRQTCLACKTESKNETATVYCMGCHEHMCTVCGETHKKYKLMRSHQLRPSEEAPSSKVKDSLQELNRCPNHENEHLEFICQDHDQPCCSKCAFTSHRKCDNVMLISDVIKDNKTYEASIKQRTDMIDNALKRVSTLCLELEAEPSRIATSYENIDKQLNEFKLRINDAYESLRSSVKKAFMAEKSKILRSSEITLNNATAKKVDILNKKEELDGVLSHGDEVQKYLYMRNQANYVDANATWQIEFTQKRIVLDKKMQPSLLNLRLENELLIPQDGRPRRPPPRSTHTLLDNIIEAIKNLVEVKQEICK
ncbi:transcription intermediary factor 1-beta-like [Dreissena polymorpha]|uniref:Uncharacterized protein n=1 Tax=Dreissena polymorpha TaxID=45954 RepID=A0A9D4F2N6_DREPO|nr:transcription intermediary factor 1-beta-like [Dreissena polymorpha]KAH3790662.1 hypothetical protein DPMN_168867 [Dreissena polymorpha]